MATVCGVLPLWLRRGGPTPWRQPCACSRSMFGFTPTPRRLGTRRSWPFFSAQEPELDVICLQEVTPAYLAALTAAGAPHAAWLAGYRLCAPDFAGTGYGTAMLVRASLAPSFARRALPSDMQRDLLLARLESPALGQVCVACVHLESKASATLRGQQLAAVREALGAEGVEAPAIVAGDFNFCSFWSHEDMQARRAPVGEPEENAALLRLFPEFEDAFPAMHGATTLASPQGFTFNTEVNKSVASPPRYEVQRCDRVLARLPPAFALVRCEVMGTAPADGLFLSDHFPLLAEWRVAGARGASSGSPLAPALPAAHGPA